MNDALTPRWTPLRYHPEQHRYIHSPHRFNVVPAGRRSGKTEIAKRYKLVVRALRGTDHPRPRFFAGAPTYAQAKRIYWRDLKDLVPKELIRRKSETELMLELVNGASIWVVGMDKPERIEGQPWDGGVLDEYGNMKAHAWTEHVRPALSDRGGWCDFIGVPEGRNHYYDLYRDAQARQQADAESSDWGAFTWVSADILPAEEIQAARRDLDELTFQQEYEASFVTFEGRAYYGFRSSDVESGGNLARLEYSPKAPLAIALDFNVAPGVAAIMQETKVEGRDVTGVIGEVWIPRNSTTPAVCRKILADWGDHRGRVTVYGDATGGARGSAKVDGSDWDLVKKVLKPMKPRYQVPAANPPERVRVNAVNARIRNTDGEVRLVVDPVKAPHVVKDFEGVRLLEGGSGEIDKKADPALTHISDAIGYYVHDEFPLHDPGTITFGTFRI